MSGTFEDIHVPPTLISFAVTTSKLDRIVSSEFKARGHKVVILKPEYGEDGLPEAQSLMENFKELQELFDQGLVAACRTPGYGGAAEAVYKMAIGNGIGFEFDPVIPLEDIFGYSYGSFIIELEHETELSDHFTSLGRTTGKAAIASLHEVIKLEELDMLYEGKLEPVYNMETGKYPEPIREVIYRTRYQGGEHKAVEGKPHFLIPVFPGTNCEYNTARAAEGAGGEAEIFVVNNLDADHLKRSVDEFAAAIRRSQAIFIPGGFSGADEPDGSGKFITSFFRNEAVSQAVMELLQKKGGLVAGICNGFQALIKLGLLPYGEIAPQTENSPTLTFNDIGRHQSKLVRTRVCSTKSPWLRKAAVGQILTVPISHGEGTFVATEDDMDYLIDNGQVLTQYVDLDNNPSMDIQYNPNGSVMAVEGILSPDGHVLGKMGHSERIGHGLYKNVPGEYDLKLFESAVDYFKSEA